MRTHTVFKMALFLVLLCMSLVTVKGEGSYCMATNTATTGTEQSLYLRVCCNNSNLGQTVQIRESNRKKIIVCPSIRLRLCSASGKQICNVTITLTRVHV